MTNCPFCNTQLKNESTVSIPTGEPGLPFTRYNCDDCGEYWVDMRKDPLTNEQNVKIASYLQTRKLNNYPSVLIAHANFKNQFVGREYPVVAIEEILEEYPKKVSEKLSRALLNLHKKSACFGQQVDIDTLSVPILYALNTGELEAILNALKDNGYIKLNRDGIAGGHTIVITAKGYERIYELEKTNSASNQAFVAMWFDFSLDNVYEEGFKKAIKDAGYEPIRIDKKEHNNIIDNEMIAEIRRSKFLIADFTGHRGGVYYEAGFAHGLGIPVIFTCNKSDMKNAHFDIAHYPHITWENGTELYQKLVNWIRATIV